MQHAEERASGPAQNVRVSELEVAVRQVDGYRFEVHFDKPFAPVVLDEPPPLGRDQGPNPARMLAAAIGDCLAASLTFCLSKRGVRVERGIEARVHMEIVRTPERRLRVGRVKVHLVPPPDIEPAALEACRGAFEDFCIVTASVRQGIAVDVELGA